MKVLEADIDVEIKRMTTEGIIELCSDSKSFNSLCLCHLKEKRTNLRSGKFQENSQQATHRFRLVSNVK